MRLLVNEGMTEAVKDELVYDMIRTSGILEFAESGDHRRSIMEDAGTGGPSGEGIVLLLVVLGICLVRGR